MNDFQTQPRRRFSMGLYAHATGLLVLMGAMAVGPGIARAEDPPARAGLLVITADDAPASGGRARWLESFRREGYVVQSVSLAPTNAYAAVFTACARMRVALRDDAVLVVLADVPARLSGLPDSETAVEWGPVSLPSQRADSGLKLEVMETLVSWVAPPEGSLFIFSLQAAAPPASGVEAVSRAAFETRSYGPRRWLSWAAEPGGRTESGGRDMGLFESCLVDMNLPARLLRENHPDDLLDLLARRVRALSGDRQKPLTWSAQGTAAPESGEELRKRIAALADRESDADAWLAQARAAGAAGYPRAALGLAVAAETLPGDATLPIRASLIRGNIRLAMEDATSLHFELAELAEHLEKSKTEGALRYESSILRAEADEAGGNVRDAAAEYGEAWSVRLALSNPPPALDVRLHAGLGRLASESGRNEEARQRFEQACERAAQLPPSDLAWGVRSSMDRARWHARIGEWDAAQTWCSRAIEQSAASPVLRQRLIPAVGDIAETLAIAGKIEPALALVARGRKDVLRPEDAEPAIWRRVQIRADMAAGRVDEAAEKMRKISAKDRAGDVAWAELEAQMLDSKGEFLQAVVAYRAAIDLIQSKGGDAARIYDLKIRQLNCYFRGGLPDRALTQCEDTLSNANLGDDQRIEVLRLAIQAAHRSGAEDKLIHHAGDYLKLNAEPAATPEEAQWMLDAAIAALHKDKKEPALELIRSSIYVAREVGMDDVQFWVRARETHAQALLPAYARAWPEALEALRLIEMNGRRVSEDAARVSLLLSDIARELGDLARSESYLANVLELLAVPNLVRDSTLADRARQAVIQLSRGTDMPPPAGTPADHLRYESAAAP